MHTNINSSKKYVILYIVTDLTTGGAQMMLYNLLCHTDKLRFQPVVVSLMDRGTFGDRIESLGIPVYTVGMKHGIPTPTAFWQLIRTVHQLKPDLIQGWMYHGNLAAQLASLFYWQKIPILWSIHHSLSSLASERKMTVAIIKFCANLSKCINQVIFVSQISKAQHEEQGYCSENSCVIPNGFDTSLFKPSVAARLEIRSELGLQENAFLIGLIGRFHPMKDHANFLKAAALLLKKNPNKHFILAGKNVDSNNHILLQLIHDLGIINHVHLLGERRDIPRLTAALDIVSLSSAYGEAFPLVIGEAMSCGVPCVVTSIGDSAWIVGDTGRFVPPRSADALANAWQELIDLGVERRQILGKAARKRIIESFSLETVVSQYEKLYERFLMKTNNNSEVQNNA